MNFSGFDLFRFLMMKTKMKCPRCNLPFLEKHETCPNCGQPINWRK